MYEWKKDIYIYSQNWTFFQSINMKISLLASVALLLLCACKHLSFLNLQSIYLLWIDKNWRLVIVTAIRNILTTSLQFRLAINFQKSNFRSENCIIMSIMSNWTTLKYFRLDLEIFYAYTDSQRDCGESCILTLQNGLHIGWFNLNNSQHIGLLKQFLFLFSVCLTETII